jgi:hypothetical protein
MPLDLSSLSYLVSKLPHANKYVSLVKLSSWSCACMFAAFLSERETEKSARDHLKTWTTKKLCAESSLSSPVLYDSTRLDLDWSL